MSTHSWQPYGFDRYGPRRRRGSASSLVAGLVAAAALLALVAVSGTGSPPASPAAGPGEVPLSFVSNAGQENAAVRFAAHTGATSFYFTREEAVLAFERGDEGLALRLGFVGANPAPELEGQSLRAGTFNYLLGSDATRWRTGVPAFGEVVYRELWPGIDMVFRGAKGLLKYEFVVRPGADPSRIALAYRGADGLAVSSAGELLVRTQWGTLRDEGPRSFQTVDGRRVPVESRFALGEAAGAYGFALGAYDPSRPLVVDPGLLYSSYLGGTGIEEARNVAFGADGSMYVTGFTDSTGFPSTAGAFDPNPNGNSDGFLTKLDAGGSLVYSTFIGGAGSDTSNSVVVDAVGNAYLAGTAGSADFPTTPGAHDASYNGSQDAFVAKLSPDGSALVFSTFLGGFQVTAAIDIALGQDGSAFVVGPTNSFATTPGAFDETRNGSHDGFVARLAPDGSELLYATYLGGTNCDLEEPVAVAVDASGNAYVAGYTSSTDFPTTDGAFDTTPDINSCDFAFDGYVTKLDPSGTDLVYSTYLNGASGEWDVAFGIALDDAGNAHVVGGTSSPDFPTTPGAFDETHNTGAFGADVFAAKLNTAGSDLVYSTFLGGGNAEVGVAAALDEVGDLYVTGYTGSSDFPTTPGAFDDSFNGEFQQDAFLARVNATGSELLYSTYFGGTGDDLAFFGVGVDDAGAAVFSGYTYSADLPTTTGALDTTYGGSSDGWVAKLATEATAPDSDGDGIPDERDIEPIRDRIDALITPDPGSPAADKLEDSLAKVESAIAKLAAGDRQGALGELEGAVGDVEAAVNGGNLDATVGTKLMRDTAAFARIIATQSIDAAEARNGDEGKIAEAEAARAQGDARVTPPDNRFKEAVGKYKDSVAKAESA